MAIHDTSSSREPPASGAEVRRPQNTSLPLDMIFEILTWLPAKSVIRFRGASKLFLTMTQDPTFIDAHLRRAAQARPARLLLFHPEAAPCLSAITVPGDDGYYISIPRPYYSKINLWESCNGMLCLSGDYGRVVLLNPATRETLELPTPSPRHSDLDKVYLGFHPATKEYKVIRFFRPNPDVWPAVCRCEVFDLGGKSWRLIGDTDSAPLSRGALVGGVMYWMADTCNTIISFDFKDENLTRVSAPSFNDVYRERSYSRSPYLVELEGCLSLMVFHSDRSVGMSGVPMGVTMDIWMLDQRREQVWARKYSIHVPDAYPVPLLPLSINEGKILIHNPCASVISNPLSQSALFYHDLKDGTATALDLHIPTKYSPFVHVDSLVPLSRSKTCLGWMV